MKNGKRIIITSHDRPPIPRDHSHDWHAWEDDDAESGPFGTGPTEAAAIADLSEQLDAKAERTQLALESKQATQ